MINVKYLEQNTVQLFKLKFSYRNCNFNMDILHHKLRLLKRLYITYIACAESCYVSMSMNEDSYNSLISY